jgi:carboxypeptidase Q
MPGSRPLTALFGLWCNRSMNNEHASQPASSEAGHSSSAAILGSEHRRQAGRILEAALSSHAAWERTALWTDTFGPRLSGSDALERAIDWALDALVKDGFANVRGEPVMVPHWVRGEESAVLQAPRRMPLTMLGLGGSVGTPPEGITAPVLVVTSFDDLKARAGEARGKIVLYDVPFAGYGKTVVYRSRGAIEAAKLGAVAVLIRSVASGSMQNPHTGNMAYDAQVPKIPAAALSVEHAMLLHRFFDRGQEVVVTLKMGAQTLPDAPSRNIVAELVGSEAPHEVVVLGGHIDSWDVGQGAMDDAGGFMAAWEAINVIRRLGLKPRRTLRLVGWTNEENGLRGARAYRDAHEAELAHHVIAMESDAGFFRPTSLSFAGDAASMPLLQEIAGLLAPAGPFSVEPGGPGADVSPLLARGVPTLSLHSDANRYMFYHHSAADTPDKLDPDDVAHGVAVIGIYAYILGDIAERVKGPPPNPANERDPSRPGGSAPSTR